MCRFELRSRQDELSRVGNLPPMVERPLLTCSRMLVYVIARVVMISIQPRSGPSNPNRDMNGVSPSHELPVNGGEFPPWHSRIRPSVERRVDITPPGLRGSPWSQE